MNNIVNDDTMLLIQMLLKIDLLKSNLEVKIANINNVKEENKAYKYKYQLYNLNFLCKTIIEQLINNGFPYKIVYDNDNQQYIEIVINKKRFKINN